MKKKKHDYFDRVLVRLRQQYSKDQTVAAISQKLSEREIEIGKLHAELDELRHELEKLKHGRAVDKGLSEKAKIEAKKEELYTNQQRHIVTLKKQIERMKNAKDILFANFLKLKRQVEDG